MPHRNGCIWIDHREAKIFGISADDVEEIVIRDPHSPLRIHRSGSHDDEKAFFEEVASKLAGLRGFIIVGPGSARTELAGFLTEFYPMLAKRIWAIEPADHPTDGELVAMARKYFRAANRMRNP